MRAMSNNNQLEDESVVDDEDADVHETPKKKNKNKLPRKRTHEKKYFQETWLQNFEYKAWLMQVKNDKTKAFCKACKTNIICGSTEIKRHHSGEKHKINLKNMLETPSVSAFFSVNNHEKKIKSAEIKLAAFIAVNNISIQIVDSLVPLLKNVFSDSKIAKDIHLGRTKCTKLIENVLCRVENDQLNNVLSKTNFSIFVDESTDLSNKKNLCVLVRYVENNKVNTQLLQLININATDCTAKTLYDHFKNCLQNRNISLENIVGMASDTAAVMIGRNNSFYKLLQDDVNHPVVLFKCICHSASLVVKSAMELLPSDIEIFLRDIGTYVSESPKSAAVLCEFQEYFENVQCKIISPGSTRWLSMQPCIINILTNWITLHHFFIYEYTFTKRKKAAQILHHFEDIEMKAYLLFLKNILNYFNRFNALFQSSSVLVHKLYEESKKILLIVARMILKPEVLHEIMSGNIIIFENLVNNQTKLTADEFNGGTEFTEYLNTEKSVNNSGCFSNEQKFNVRNNCAKFTEKCFYKIIQKFPLNEEFFKTAEFLNPEVALNILNRKFSKTLSGLHAYLEHVCDKYRLEDEWGDVSFEIADNEKQRLQVLSVEEFWKEISGIKALNGDCVFPNLSKAAKFILTLPHSNADAERIFSMVTDIKTKKRNRIGEDCLNALCVFKSSMQNKNINAVSFEPDDKHFSLITSSNLYQN